MDLNVWLLYLVTEFILTITPGPAVLLVTAHGMKFGSRSGCFGALGISTSNLIYFMLSALGLGAVIIAAGDLFFWIRMAGAIYLITTGTMMIKQSFQQKQVSVMDIKAYQSNRKSYLQGFITQIVNPKAIIFFVALLPQFVNPDGNIFIQFTILASTTIIMETFVLILFAWLASEGRKFLSQQCIIRNWQDKLAGSILVGLGINLLFVKMKQG
jgi:homoserine/homoserine lactone efflux protein